MHGVLALGVLAASGPAFAGTLTPWGAHTPAGETWLTPYLFANADGISNNTYLSIGLGSRVDLIGGVGVGFDGRFRPGVVEAIPRWFLTDGIGLAMRVGSVPGMSQLEVGPELHATWSTLRFGFTTNLGWRPVVGDKSGWGSAFAVVAPELFLTKALSVYTEVNPGLDLDARTINLSVVPGLSLSIGIHGFSVGAILPAADPRQWTVGAWYSVRVGQLRQP